MAIKVTTDGTRYTVGSLPKPKTDQEGRQKRDRVTGEDLMATQLIQIDENGAEVINVTTPGMPRVEQGDEVSPRNLIAIPWQQGQRSGVAFRADALDTPTAPAVASANGSASTSGSASTAKGGQP